MARKTEDAGAPAEEKFVTFMPAQTFTGWPLDDYAMNRKGVLFTKGVESPPVPESFAALMREKGLVVEEAVAIDAAVAVEGV